MFSSFILNIFINILEYVHLPIMINANDPYIIGIARCIL